MSTLYSISLYVDSTNNHIDRVAKLVGEAGSAVDGEVMEVASEREM